MKVATLDINGVVSRLADLLEWLTETEPDWVRGRRDASDHAPAWDVLAKDGRR